MVLVRHQTLLMGNTFEFILLSQNETEGKQLIELAIHEIKRIEQLFTTYKGDS